MLSDSYPPPPAFGLPQKFERWREEQVEAIERSSRSKHRFVCHALPTGSGKSLAGIGLAMMMGWRVAYLTSTKGLQSQLNDDFGCVGLQDMRGQNNYRCRLVMEEGSTDNITCDHGPCHAGYGCRYISYGCEYFDSLRSAKRAPLVTTNYHYWTKIHQNTSWEAEDDKRRPLGKFDLLILDECHNAPDELASALSFKFTSYELQAVIGCDTSPFPGEDVKKWSRWAPSVIPKVDRMTESIRLQVKEKPSGPARTRYKHLMDIQKKLIELRDIQGEWVANTNGNAITFSPVWPGHYSYRLFLDVKNVVMMSATVRPKTAELMGISEEAMEFYEYDSSFAANLRPVFWVPTVRLNHSASDEHLRIWVMRIDQIIRGRLDRKGIVHTVSYNRRNLVINNSEYRSIMYAHDSHNTSMIVNRFKRSNPPAVLVSPSVSTGWDFPLDECRYQIIGKLAFIDTRDKIAKARCDADSEYSAYIAMQELIQACGRVSIRSRQSCPSYRRHILEAWSLPSKLYSPYPGDRQRSRTVPARPGRHLLG